MIVDIAYIILALLLLFAGAEAVVRGSASVAMRAGVSRLMVGLTVVALGTSSPELVVSINAAMSQQADIAVGNVIGSNIFNIGVILGLTALLCPIPVRLQLIKVDVPILLGITLLLTLLLWNQHLGPLEGLLLFMGLIAYLWISVVLGRKSETESMEELSIPSIVRDWRIDVLLIVLGLGVLIFSSQLLIDHAASLATLLGVGQAVIALTIIAAGTSMPELATSLIAAARREPDIAIGNIVGSNIFNILAILGAAAMVSPLTVVGISLLDYAILIVMTVLLLPLLYTGRLLHRLEALVLLMLYGGYLVLIWPD